MIGLLVERDSDDVVSSSQIRTLSKQFIPIDTEDGLIGNADPVVLDVDASNGVIHVIDAVLLPDRTRVTTVPPARHGRVRHGRRCGRRRMTSPQMWGVGGERHPWILLLNVRGTTSIASILIGALMVIGGIGTWFLVSSTLEDQRITVADDASCMAGELVNGPIDAYCQAEIIDQHALEATNGQTYAELDRDDPLREVAMNSSFLQASLFTSVLAFGVSAMAVAGGVLFILIGIGIRDVASHTMRHDHEHVTAA